MYKKWQNFRLNTTELQLKQKKIYFGGLQANTCIKKRQNFRLSTTELQQQQRKNTTLGVGSQIYEK
jgi:hypothetical protein